MIRPLVAAAVIAAVVALPAAASPTTIVRGDLQLGSFHTRGGLLSDARGAFGKPSSTRKKGSMTCSVAWRDLGLAATFLDLEQKDPCGAGGFVQGTMIGHAWRTTLGLRVGDSAARVSRLYPHASRHRGSGPTAGWWLVTRHACELGGYEPFPGLLARVAHGRVAAFVVQLGVCE